MEAIVNFLNEMRKSDWGDYILHNQRTYNGVKLVNSKQAYYNKLIPLYDKAVLELISIPNEKINIICDLVAEIEEVQANFETPSQELLSSLLSDYDKSRAQIKSLKEDYNYLIFVKGCMTIQKSLLNCFKQKLKSFTDASYEVLEVIDEGVKYEEGVIKGIKGLANFLNKGTTTAQSILNSGVLQNEGVAYRVGNGWNFNTEKLSLLLEKKPNLLAKRGGYRV